MNPLRQPVSFLKKFEQELRQGQLTPKETKERLNLVETNVDTIADIIQDNFALNDLMSSIFNRSWKLLAEDQTAIPAIIKKIQGVATSPLRLEGLIDVIASKIDEMHVLVSEAMLEKMHRVSPLMKKEFPVLEQGKLSFKEERLLPEEWLFLVAFYENEDSLAHHRFSASVERYSNLIHFCHRYGLKDAEKYFVLVLREYLLKSVEQIPGSNDAYYRVVQMSQVIDMGFELDNEALKKIGIDGLISMIKAAKNFYLKEVKKDFSEGNPLLETHLNSVLWLLEDVVRTEWKKAIEKHDIFDSRLKKPQGPYLDLFRKIAELPIETTQLQKRNAILLQFIRSTEKRLGWNFDGDPERLLQILLRTTSGLESKSRYKKQVRKELQNFLKQFPYGVTTLDLRQIPLKYGHLQCLRELQGLKELKINGEEISSSEIARLKKKLPDIIITI